jgi:hypothetical protein
VATLDFPSRRHGITGTNLDGERVELSFSISKQLYRCPGCRGQIPIGSEHVVVRITPKAGAAFHQHWHRDCVPSLTRELRDVQRKPRT